MRYRNICFIVMFSLLLVTPAIVSLFSEKDNGVNIENRESAKKPIFATDTMANTTFMKKVACHVNGLKGYCADYNRYYVDNFVFRNQMTKYYMAAKMRLGTAAMGKNIIIGKDGWYFLGDLYSNIVSESMGYKPIPDNEMFFLKQNVLQCKSFCDSLNIPVVFVVAPNKMSIYYEYFPYQSERKESRYDQVNEVMSDLDIPYVDLKSILLSNKEEGGEDLYRHIDSHWSFHGAYIAYLAIMEKFKPHLSDLTILTDSMFVKSTAEMPGDLTSMLAMPEVLESSPVYYPIQYPAQNDSSTQHVCGSFQYIKRHSTSDAKGKVLIFGDSFSCVLSVYFSSSFHESLFYQAIGGICFDKEVVLREKPDCILVEVCEREVEKLTLLMGHYCE